MSLGEFEEMCRVISKNEGPPMSLQEISKSSLDELLKECARRVVADVFLRTTGERLFQEYCVVRFISKGVFSWLFAEGKRPSFLS